MQTDKHVNGISERNEVKLAITQWAEDDRPREKLESHGAESLSNAELLAILIGSGTPRESAVELMKRVMADCSNNLNTLGKLSIRELMLYKGIGKAKAITILAACELGKRRQTTPAEERPQMDSAQAIYDYMHPKMQDLPVEQAWVLLLNQNFRLIKAVKVSSGGISETAVDIRMILKEALLNNATVIALTHNHPSLNATPSSDDVRITMRLEKACETMRIYFLDHVIVTDGKYYSYREHDKI